MSHAKTQKERNRMATLFDTIMVRKSYAHLYYPVKYALLAFVSQSN